MKKALTLEQMDELVRLGVPTTQANRGYERHLKPKSGVTELPLNPVPGSPDYVWSGWKPVKFYRTWEGNPRVQSRPAFNVENMLDLLPAIVDVNFTLQMKAQRDGTWYVGYHSGLDAEADDLLDALYALYIKWLDYKIAEYGNGQR